MSDETTVKEPRTEAGRYLATVLGAFFADNTKEGDIGAATRMAAAIEDEARSAVLAEVRAAVEGLTPTGMLFMHSAKESCCRNCHEDDKRRLLALIDHISEGK